MEAIKETILIIEDDAGLIELLSEKVESCGFQTACVLSAGDALAWLNAHTPFLILLDYGLPNMSGKEFIAELKKKEKEIPPFVVATGQGDERIAVEMMKYGARDYIIKDGHFLEMIPLIISKVCGEIEKENKLKSVEKALAESTQFNSQIITCAEEGIVVYDLNQKYITWNPFIEKLIGVPSSAVLGRNAREVFPFLIESGVIANVEQALQGVLKPAVEFVIFNEQTGKSTWVSDAVSTLRNVDGEIIGAISTVRDISERKFAEMELVESESRYHTLFNASFEAVFLTAPDGEIFSANPAACAMFMLSEDELKQKGRSGILDLSDQRLSWALEVREKTGKFSGELSFVKGSGETFPGDLSSTIFKDKDGNDRTSMIIRDITGRKQAEALLNQERELYLDLVNSQPAGVYRIRVFPIEKWDEDGWNSKVNSPYCMELASERFCEILGVTRQQFEENPLLIVDLIHPDEKEGFVTRNEEANTKLIPFFWEGRMIIHQKITWIHLESLPRQLPNGDVLYTGIVYDISVQKQTEEALAYQSRLQHLLMHISAEFINLPLSKLESGISVSLHDLGLFVGADRSYIFSYDFDRQIATNTYEWCDAGIEPQIDHFKEVPMSEMPGWAETHGRNESIYIPDVRSMDPGFLKDVFLQQGIKSLLAVPMMINDECIGFVGFDSVRSHHLYTENEQILLKVFAQMLVNIQLRKQSEDALKTSEDKYRTMIEFSNDLIWILDTEGCFTFLNEMALKTTGYKYEEWIGKSFVPLILEEDLPMISDVFHKTIYGEPCSYELRLIKTDESILTISVNTSPVYVSGEIVGIVSFGQDITEHKRAEDALRESEELYRNLVSRIPDGVYKSTVEGKFVDVNPALVRMLGYGSKEELLGIDIKSQLYFDISDRESKTLNGQNEEMSVFRLKKKDGSGIWIEDHGWYNFSDNGGIISHEGVLRDITVRKLAQDALLESENMLKKTLFESSGLIENTSEGIDFQKILDTILGLSGAKYAGFNVFDEEGLEFTTVALSGIKENILKASSYLGFEIINKKWKHDPVRTEKIKDRTITRFDSLHELADFSIPDSISKIIEKTFNIGEVIIVKIKKENKAIGDFTLFFSREETIKNTELVTLFANQVGLFIERKNAEESLNEKMDELIRFQRLTVGRELTMIKLKKEVNELLMKNGEKGKYTIVG